MDMVLVILELTGGMYGTSSAVVCILAEDDDDISFLGNSLGRGVNDLESWDLMVVNTTYIEGLLVDVVNTRVIAKNATISTAVNKGTVGAS